MTMLLVDPVERWVAADRRVCYGQMYQDNFSKIRQVHGVVMAVCGAPHVLDTAVAIGWELWMEGKAARDLTLFVRALREQLSSQLEDGGIQADLVVACGDKAFHLEEHGGIFPVTEKLALGSGMEGGQVLLNYEAPVEKIFRTVAGCNFTVSATYDLVRY